MQRFLRPALPVVMAVIVLAGAPAAAQQFGHSVTLSGATATDVYAAGGTVNILSDVAGDLVVAGGTVTATGAIGGDLLAGAGSLTVTGGVADDVRAAGGSVTIAGDTGGDVIAAGGSLALAADRQIGGRAWLAGGLVDVGSDVDGEVRIGGREVTLRGRIGGDVRVLAERLRVDSGAQIGGDLHYGGPNEPDIDPGARIDGRVVYSKVDFGKRFEIDVPVAGGLVLFAAVLAVSILIVLWVLPRGLAAAARVLAGEPLRSVAMGLVVLIVTPVLAVLLGVTVLALPLAVALFFGWFVLLIGGYLVAVAALGWLVFRCIDGDGAARHTLRRILAVVVAAVAVAATGYLPAAGALAGLLLLLFGSGATAIALFRAGRR